MQEQRIQLEPGWQISSPAVYSPFFCLFRARLLSLLIFPANTNFRLFAVPLRPWPSFSSTPPKASSAVCGPAPPSSAEGVVPTQKRNTLRHPFEDQRPTCASYDGMISGAGLHPRRQSPSPGQREAPAHQHNDLHDIGGRKYANFPMLITLAVVRSFLHTNTTTSLRLFLQDATTSAVK